jgi:hypothetical protein
MREADTGNAVSLARRRTVIRQFGIATTHLFFEYAEGVQHDMPDNPSILTLNLYNEEEHTIASLEATMRDSQPSDTSLILAGLAVGGYQDEHHTYAVTHETTLSRVDSMGVEALPRESGEGMVSVTLQEVADLHHHVLGKSDAGLLVPITTTQAYELQGLGGANG